MNTRALMRARHSKTHLPVTAQGKAITNRHMAILGSLTALDRDLKGTVWEATGIEVTNYVREALEEINSLVMDLELSL